MRFRLHPSHLLDLTASTQKRRCIGVFDTVGSIGLPEEISRKSPDATLFGFSDKLLGAHVERAYHAMALNERRADFVRYILYLEAMGGNVVAELGNM